MDTMTEAGERVTVVTRQTRVVSFERREALVEKVCPQCTRPFAGLRRARYCSHACAQRAAYARNADRVRAARRERYQRRKAERAAARDPQVAPKAGTGVE